MDLMQQCAQWNEEDQYQKIIEAIENLPQEQRTPELISELARAYNNYGRQEYNNEKTYQEYQGYFHKALKLLKCVKDEFIEEHNWNFRMAYAYMFLGQDIRAIHYYKKALEYRPKDEDTIEFIEYCTERQELPRVIMPFMERVTYCWEEFVKKESYLRQLMDEKKNEDLIHECSEILLLAFDSASFELGKNGDKYEIILTPEGDYSELFKYIYFKKKAPTQLLESWKITVGRTAAHFSLQAFGESISAEDVKTWITIHDKDNISLELYCEKLSSLLETEEDKVWWIICTLVDQTLGEIPAMKLIHGVDILDKPKDQDYVLLDNIIQELQQKELSLVYDPEVLASEYSSYTLEPHKDEDVELRFDIYIGMTRHTDLINNYWNQKTDHFDNLYNDGAIAGYFYFPLYSFAEKEDYSNAVLDFRYQLQDQLEDIQQGRLAEILGGATGVYYGYIDFITWDLMAFLEEATHIFETLDIPWISYHSLRYDGQSYCIVNNDNNEELLN